MKTAWICTYSTVPHDDRHTERFKSVSDAKRAMAQKIRETLNIKPYLDALRREEGEDCPAAADFLEKFFSDLELPESVEEAPDFPDVPGSCDLSIATDFLRWSYDKGEHPLLLVRHSLWADEQEEFVVDLSFEYPQTRSASRKTGISITITPQPVFGTSAYPLLVLRELNSTPKTHTQISNAVRQKYGCTMERKAVGRHIELLSAMGYPIKHYSQGYYLESKETLFTQGDILAIQNCVLTTPLLPEAYRNVLAEKLNKLKD